MTLPSLSNELFFSIGKHQSNMAFYKTSKCENISHLINRVPITTMRCHPAKHGNLVWEWKSGINSLNKRDFYCHFKKDFLKKEEIYVINLSVTDYGLLNIKKWPIQFCKMVDETLKTIVWKIFYFFPCQKYNGTPSFDLGYCFWRPAPFYCFYCLSHFWLCFPALTRTTLQTDF